MMAKEEVENLDELLDDVLQSFQQQKVQPSEPAKEQEKPVAEEPISASWEKDLANSMEKFLKDLEQKKTEEERADLLEETIQRLDKSSLKVTEELGQGSQNEEQMLQDLLKGLEGEDMSQMLESMMQQLMSKDVLYEPLQDLAKQYPEWLRNNQNHENYQQYKKQYECSIKVLQLFDDLAASKTNEEQKQIRADIQKWMSEMQSCGAPPPEILKSLSPDLKLDESGLPVLPDDFMDPSQCNMQ